MKELVMALIVSISGQADISADYGYIKTDQRVIAQHAVGKNSGQNYVVVNERYFRQLDKQEQIETIVHEMAHGVVYNETGHASHDHGSDFMKACKALTYKVKGATRSACSANVVR